MMRFISVFKKSRHSVLSRRRFVYDFLTFPFWEKFFCHARLRGAWAKKQPRTAVVPQFTSANADNEFGRNYREVPTMLIRNAKDSAGKAVEVWLRDGKIAAVGLGLLVPEGRRCSTRRAARSCPPSSTPTATGAPPALSTRRTSPPAPPRLPRWVHLRQPDAQHEAGLLQCRDRPRRRGRGRPRRPVRRKPDHLHTKDFDGKTLDHLLTLPEDIKFITETATAS